VTTDRTRWLDEEEMRAWRGLVDAYADLSAALESDLLAGFGIDGDRRVTMAVLTDTGRATLEAAAPVHVAGVRANFVDRLSRAQLRQLGVAFEALRRPRGTDELTSA